MRESWPGSATDGRTGQFCVESLGAADTSVRATSGAHWGYCIASHREDCLGWLGGFVLGRVMPWNLMILFGDRDEWWVRSVFLFWLCLEALAWSDSGSEIPPLAAGMHRAGFRFWKWLGTPHPFATACKKTSPKRELNRSPEAQASLNEQLTEFTVIQVANSRYETLGGLLWKAFRHRRILTASQPL
jgi:hypothetical protein